MIFWNTRSPEVDLSDLDIDQAYGDVRGRPRPEDYHIQDWQEAKLPRPALVRARLATLKASQVLRPSAEGLRKLGEVTEGDLRAVQEALRGVICQ